MVIMNKTDNQQLIKSIKDATGEIQLTTNSCQNYVKNIVSSPFRSVIAQ